MIVLIQAVIYLSEFNFDFFFEIIDLILVHELFIIEFPIPDGSEFFPFESEDGEGDDHDGHTNGVKGDGIEAECIAYPPYY